MPTTRFALVGTQALMKPVRWGAFAALLTAMFTLFIPNQYRSEARILPADQRGAVGVGGLAAAAAAVGVSIPGQESADAAYVDILTSRWLREQVLRTSFTFKVKTWRFGQEEVRTQTLYDFLQAKNYDRAVVALKACTSVNRDLKSKLLTISVETISPELSQQIAQRMVRLLDEFVVAKARTRGGAKAAFAEKRLIEARQELVEAESELLKFLDKNRNYVISPDPSIRLKGQRLDNELKLRGQLVMTLAISREQALLEEKNDMPILNVLDAGNLPEDKSRPSRSSIVLAMFAGAALLKWVYMQRDLILRRLSTSSM